MTETDARDAAFFARERDGEAWAQQMMARLPAHRPPVVFTIADDTGGSGDGPIAGRGRRDRSHSGSSHSRSRLVSAAYKLKLSCGFLY